jgi:hypothetical protein
VRPNVIDAIRDAHQRAAFEEKIRRAASDSDLTALAEGYAKDNDRLSALNRSQADELSKLQVTVANLETRLRHAEQVGAARTAEVLPAPQAEDEERPPRRGETRFYKKIRDTGLYDVMREVADCGHNNWQGAHRADKAKKGIERSAGSKDWQSIHHCARCTGGGVWKVRW